MKQESVLTDEQRQAAKKRMMALLQEGYSWQEYKPVDPPLTAGSNNSAHCGVAVLQDGRHGHIAKMHQPIREWLEVRCRREPNLPNSSLQKELHAHFGVLISITHLNRIRGAHGLERPPTRMGEKSGPKLST